MIDRQGNEIEVGDRVAVVEGKPPFKRGTVKGGDFSLVVVWVEKTRTEIQRSPSVLSVMAKASKS